MNDQLIFHMLLNNNLSVKSNYDIHFIAKSLELNITASVTDIITAIKKLKGGTNSVQVIDEALKLKLIDRSDKEHMLRFAKQSPSEFAKFIEGKKVRLMKERENEGEKLLMMAFRDGRLSADESGMTRNFWMDAFRNDFERTKYVVDNMPSRKPVHDTLQFDSDESKHDLRYYRKHAPNELKNNPGLYKQLVESERNKKNQ